METRAIWTTSVLKLYPKDCSSPFMYISVSFDDRVLLCIPNFMAWWSDNIQLLMEGSDCMINEGSWLSIQALVRPNSKTSCFLKKQYLSTEDVRAMLQNLKAL